MFHYEYLIKLGLKLRNMLTNLLPTFYKYAYHITPNYAKPLAVETWRSLTYTTQGLTYNARRTRFTRRRSLINLLVGLYFLP